MKRQALGSSALFLQEQRNDKKRFFTNFTTTKGLLYGFVIAYVVAVSVVFLVEKFLPDSILCGNVTFSDEEIARSKLEYGNVSYEYDPCRHVRTPFLLFFTRSECDFGRRLVCSVILGAIVGWERREADRPAGIRTMSLVSLGACLFSIDSVFAFLDGPMTWDSSRVSAAIPSGVGFIGAGLIFKEQIEDKESGNSTHMVHGLHTAATVWLSAAIGVACAGRLYFHASFTVALVLSVLRFGPRQVLGDEDDDDDGQFPGYSSIDLSTGEGDVEDPEREPLTPLKRSKKKLLSLGTGMRKRPSLGAF